MVWGLGCSVFLIFIGIASASFSSTPAVEDALTEPFSFVEAGDVALAQVPSVQKSAGALTACDSPSPQSLSTQSADVLVIVMLLALTLLAVNIVEKLHLPVPEAIVIIVVGILLAGIATATSTVSQSTFAKLEQVSARQFMLIFLAPIIFAEGYGLKSRQFFANITRILVYAFVGTLISTIVVAYMVFYLPPLTGLSGKYRAPSFTECLTFGALISAVDPVTTLAIFKEQNMVENGLGYLYYSVLGESIINDAVAITLANSFGELVIQDQEITGGVILDVTWKFCVTFVGSMLIGILCGMLTALLLKVSRLGTAGAESEEHFYFNATEIAVTLVMSYVPFLVGNAANLSGIVAILFAGITMRHYAHYNLTVVTRQVFLPLIELIATLCEVYVFLLLGVGVFALKRDFSAPVILWTFVACLIGRAVHVYPLTWIVNRTSSGVKLTMNETHVVWFAGLRGAVAFMVALNFPVNQDDHGPDADHIRQLFECTTAVIVGVTIAGFGWPTASVLRCLKIGHPAEEAIALAEGAPRVTGMSSGSAAGHHGTSTSWFKSCVGKFFLWMERMLMTPDGYAERTAVAGMITRRDSAARHSTAVQAQMDLSSDGPPGAAGDNIGTQRAQTLPGNCGIREQFGNPRVSVPEGAPRASVPRGPHRTLCDP
eukprot:CAMPEP_0194485158 /NCGR_PEP_ID=MMETSP0253-20130528/6253_1 /TAXON_ID=2966 /ORGANISM="Noctiluca scintillans" /LENGTH=657 /DNA_ID=CAMNT_0039325095 /DNA_START=43 /DNA_END=2016 /DNA_ORIENTATION=+